MTPSGIEEFVERHYKESEEEALTRLSTYEVNIQQCPNELLVLAELRQYLINGPLGMCMCKTDPQEMTLAVIPRDCKVVYVNEASPEAGLKAEESRKLWYQRFGLAIQSEESGYLRHQIIGLRWWSALNRENMGRFDRPLFMDGEITASILHGPIPCSSMFPHSPPYWNLVIGNQLADKWLFAQDRLDPQAMSVYHSLGFLGWEDEQIEAALPNYWQLRLLALSGRLPPS